MILFSLKANGVVLSSIRLAEELTKREYAVTFVVIRPGGQLADAIPDSIEVVRLNVAAARYQGYRAVSRIAKYLRSARPDVVIATNVELSIATICASWSVLRKPRLITIERNDPNVTHNFGTGFRGWIWPRLVRYMYPLADLNAAVSAGAARELSRRLRRVSTRVLPLYNAFKIEPIGASIGPRHPWLVDRGDHQVVVTVGRLEPQKDQATLIRAAAHLSASHPKLRFIIFGEGNLRRDLEKLANDLGISGRVDLPGYSPTVRGEISAADLFVLSSKWEGLPGVVVEALAEHTPVVSTDCTYGPREVLGDNEFGTLVPVGDPIALAAAIADALAHPRAVDFTAAVARFEPKRAADAYEAAMFPETAKE